MSHKRLPPSQGCWSQGCPTEICWKEAQTYHHHPDHPPKTEQISGVGVLFPPPRSEPVPALWFSSVTNGFAFGSGQPWMGLQPVYRWAIWKAHSFFPGPAVKPHFGIALKKIVSCSVTSSLYEPHGLLSTRLLCPWDFPVKSTEMGSHYLLQGIFLTQGSNPTLLHCWRILYSLSHQALPWPHLKGWVSTGQRELERVLGTEPPPLCWMVWWWQELCSRHSVTRPPPHLGAASSLVFVDTLRNGWRRGEGGFPALPISSSPSPAHTSSQNLCACHMHSASRSLYLPHPHNQMAASTLSLMKILEVILFPVNLIFTPTWKWEKVLKKNAFRLECCKPTPTIFSFSCFLNAVSLRDLWSWN